MRRTGTSAFPVAIPVVAMLEALAAWIESSGPLMFALAPLFTVFVAVLPVPAEIPAILNGMVFGPIWGSLVTWAGALAGAQISFELARRFGRPLSARVVPDRFMARADAAVTHAGWPILLGLRLMPTVAFTAVNWAAGLTTVPRATFVWTTALGILPGAIAFTTGGAGILSLGQEGGRSALLLSLAGLILLATAAAGLLWRYRTSNVATPRDER